MLKFRHSTLVIGFALLAGLFLRSFQLSEQLITGDEWHAIRAVMNTGYAYLLTHFGGADYSIPVAVYYKWLLENMGLRQWSMQLPPLAAGSAVIAALPLMLRSRIGSFAAGLLALLLAISPFLIAYSRFARPYSAAFLFSLLAAICFYQWWEGRHVRPALLYVLFCCLAAYHVAVILPYVLGPFLCCAAFSLRKERRLMLRDLQQLAVLGTFTCIGLAALLGPPLINDFSTLSSKVGVANLGPGNLWAALAMLAGTHYSWGLGILLLGAGAGIAFTIKRRDAFLLYLLILGLLQIIAIMIVSPWGGLVLARYLIPVLGVLLIMLAVGMQNCGLMFKGAWRQSIAVTAGIAALAAIALNAPLGQIVSRPNNAVTMNLFSFFHLGNRVEEMPSDMEIYINHHRSWPWSSARVEEMLSDMDISKFYQQLADEPAGQFKLVEAPYYYNGDFYFAYQKLHRQHIGHGFLDHLCAEGRYGEIPLGVNVELNNYYYLAEPDSMRKDGVDFVVFHKDINQELAYPELSNADFSVCLQQYRDWFGSPHFEDEYLIVFSLDSPANAKP